MLKVSIFDELNWKLPKLKVGKIECRQNWKLPKLEIAKIESSKNESDLSISCQKLKIAKLKVAKVESSQIAKLPNC